MTRTRKRPVEPEAINNPAATQAFLRVCARLAQVSGVLTSGNVVGTSSVGSPFHRDMAWIERSLEPTEAEGFGEAFGEHVRNHRGRIAIAGDHVGAMKTLARHMTAGYEVAASHARAVLLAAISLHHLMGPGLSAEARMCRFAAHLLEQGAYSGRLGGVISAWVPEADGEDAGASVAENLTALGFELKFHKNRGGVRAVHWGDSMAETSWNASAVARDLGSMSEFSWFLTSGAAHVEPWATNSFSEGTVDFYGTMAQAALIPAYRSITADVAGYFGVDMSSQFERIAEVESSFGAVMEQILRDRVAELPEGHPFARILRQRIDVQECLLSLLAALPDEGAQTEVVVAAGSADLENEF